MRHRRSRARALLAAAAISASAVIGLTTTTAHANTIASVVLMANQPLHTMTEGVGSDMTSLITSRCHEVSTANGCGSAYGGLPPASDDAHWNSLLGYASFLGEDWIRLQLEQYQYEPQDGTFTWDSPNMQALYRIAQWAKDHGVDILLQQDWQATDWNAIPSTSYDVAHSAPADLNTWSASFATMVDYLINTKGFTNIKLVNISNEPMNSWGWWRGGADISAGYQAARSALDARGISVPLAGPEYSTNNNSSSAWAASGPYLGAFEGHEYPAPGSDNDPYAYRPSVVGATPVLWGEYGSAHAGTYADNIGFDRWMIGGMSNGVDGTARWQYTNQNDIDGDFSLVNTWDTTNKTLLATYSPHPDSYYLHAMMSRFTAKYSTAYASFTSLPSIVPTLVKSPNGAYTVLAANLDTANDTDVTFTLQGLDRPITLYRYSITEANSGQSNVTLAPSGSFTVSPTSPTFTDTMSKDSVYAYSTYDLPATADGIVSDGAYQPLTTPHPLSDNASLIQESDPAITYSSGWATDTNSAYSGGTVRYSNTAGAYYQFSFTGTDFRLYGKQDSGSGLGSVYIDGVFSGYENSYAPLTMYRMMTYDSGPLASGSHTVKVVVGGQHTVTKTGTYINVDAIGYGNTLAANPGFEADGVATTTPSGWTKWGPNPEAAYTENKGGAYSGSFNLSNYATYPYEVSTYQTVTSLPNGLYTLRAKVESSGGQTTAVLGAKSYGGTELQTPIPQAATWQTVSIPNINVTNGQCVISIYSKAGASQWITADDVEFFKQ